VAFLRTRQKIALNKIQAIALKRSLNISFLRTTMRPIQFCIQYTPQQLLHRGSRRAFFTNTDQMNREDPYQQLGLQWGDGATTAEIRQAYRRKAAQLHPDVNKKDSPQVALRKFQELQRAYQSLMKIHSHAVSTEKEEEWRFSVWRNGDRIATNRTDVAGVLRKRPKPPAELSSRQRGALLGHPSGTGTVIRNEYLGDGQAAPSSSVGRGQSKWVKPKEFVPWDGKVVVSASERVKSKK
jgi:hypothetical protein